jgi:hypothetical protein
MAVSRVHTTTNRVAVVAVVAVAAVAAVAAVVAVVAVAAAAATPAAVKEVGPWWRCFWSVLQRRTSACWQP